MSEIFISYSTKNKELVEQVIELLQGGAGLERQMIFCTSFREALPTGENFISIIRQKIKECKMAIALITPEYLQSKFCLMELGAAWANASYLCPILAQSVDYKDLDDTPLKNLQMRKLDSNDDWYAIYSEMISQQIITDFEVTQFMRKLSVFLNRECIG